MKLKLDLHPLFNDGTKIEAALRGIIDEAIDKRAAEVEIIPGKGSGALKKTVLRFLARPEVRSRYHRIEKDGDNWGRLFVHFRHERRESDRAPGPVATTLSVPCACCGDPIEVAIAGEESPASLHVACPWCGSPNRISIHHDRRGNPHASTQLAYPDP